MAKQDSVSIAVIASATALPVVAGVVLQWDGKSGICQEVGHHPLLVQGQHAAFQVAGPLPAPCQPLLDNEGDWPRACRSPAAHRVGTGGSLSDLFPCTGPAGSYRPRGARWRNGRTGVVHWPEQSEALTLSVHPVLLVHTPHEGLGAERVNIRPALLVADPLLPAQRAGAASRPHR